MDRNRKYFDVFEKEYEKAKGKKERIPVFKLKHVKEITDWSKVRPYLSSDFIDDVKLETQVFGTNVPDTTQENQLVSDLIASFLGVNSHFIQAETLSNRNAIRTFKIVEGLDVKLQNLAEKCLKLSEYYSQLCRFTEDNRLLSVGRVNQALASAIEVTLMEYKNFVVQMQILHLERKLNLQELWFQVQEVMHIFNTISNIVLDITKKQLRGGSTLSYLYEQRSQSFELGETIKFLTKKAAVPYMESLKEWIYNGIIFDPFDEFMITEKQKPSVKEPKSLEYWERRYLIRTSYMPSFLESVANEILKSGAYLNVIKESILPSGKAKLAPIEELKFSWKKPIYLDVIRRAYTYSSSYLLNHMMDQYQIWDRFVFMKRYFLVQQGDFIEQVLDLCNEELSKVITEVVPCRLETLVDMAIKGVEYPAIRDELTVALQPQDLCHQVSKILSVSSTLEQIQKKESPNLKLTGYESFTLNMNCKWPLSLIFNTRVISCYQMLFRLLFYTKHIEKLLFKIWMIDQKLRKFTLHNKKQYSVIYSLRHRMIYFIQNMQYYMMEEAIEPNWIDFQKQIQKFKEPIPTETIRCDQFEFTSSAKVYCIDDLLDVHLKFLNKCINDCLLSNSVLFPIFMTLISVCKEFVTVVLQHEDQINNLNISDEDDFTKSIFIIEKKFQEQYLLFLKTIKEFAPTDVEASKILEILNRANFNNFFNSQLDNEF